MVGNRIRAFRRKHLKTNEQIKIDNAITNDWWYENVLLDFIASYQLQNKSCPTRSSIERAGIVPPERLVEITQKLVDGGWITTWNNRYQHYECKIAY